MCERLEPWLTRSWDDYLSAHLIGNTMQRICWTPSEDTPLFYADAPTNPEDGLSSRPYRTLGDLGRFGQNLRHAGLFDHTALDLPGAVVTLPAGLELLRHYCSLVREFYTSIGLVEYDYPSLTSIEAVESFSEVHPAMDSILFVGLRSDLAESRACGALLPTGEPVIYQHWRGLVRDELDLPLTMFRRATFFRPWSSTRRGGSIFRSLEGSDTFEFHCCYRPSDAAAGAVRLFEMLQQLTGELGVPTFWSTRPPWSNNASVCRVAIGGDCPIPTGATLQIATLYDQRDRFSSSFGIRYRDSKGDQVAPWHVVGAVSRRLLMTHLLLGMCTDGSFIVHPRISPSHVHLITRRTSLDSDQISAPVESQLAREALRVKHTVVDGARELRRALRRKQRLLATLTVVVQGRRSPTDDIRVIVRRNDNGSEYYLRFQGTWDTAGPTIREAIYDVQDSFQERMSRYAQSRSHRATSLDDARRALASRLVVIASMDFVRSSVETVSGWRQGEILGFVHSDGDEPCVLSGRLASTIAFISPRA